MNEHVKIGQPVEIGDAQARLAELVSAALRGEDVILSDAGEPQARIVPLGARTIEQILAAEKAMTPEQIRKRGARRRAAIGMYEHLVTGPIPDVRDLKPTDDEILERERRKFGDLR